MRLYKTHMWFRERRMPVRIVICKSRRAGLSTGVEALMYDDTVTHPNSYSLVIANERNPSENTLKMVHRFWRYTPEYMTVGDQRIKVRPSLPPQFQGQPSKDRLEFILDTDEAGEPVTSSFFSATARSLDSFLGYGFSAIHATEASRYIDGHELFRAVYPTLVKGEHSALYVESTPAGQDGRGRFFYELVMDAAARKKAEYGDMKLVFIPWHEMIHSFSVPFKEPSKEIAFSKSLDKTENELLRRFPHISMAQLQWRRMVLAGPAFNRDEEMWSQEYPEDLATCFLTSGSCVFTRKTIRRLQSNVRPPIFEGDVYFGESPAKNASRPIHELVREPKLLNSMQARDQGYKSHVNEGTYKNLKIFRYAEKGERLFVTCDVGQGMPESKDGDYSTMGVFVLNELERDELIMTWRGHINPIAFGEVSAALCWLLVSYVGERVTMPELLPEWTGPGVGMCTYIDSKNLYPHLYRYQQPGIHTMPKSKHIGWESNAKTKPMMVGYTCRMVEMDMIDIPDADVVLEMSSYRKIDDFGDTASYEGAAGRHDDLVSMLQIGCAILRIRSATIPGDADALEVDVGSASEYDKQLPPFDPFASIPGMDGVTYGDFDEESEEEANRWW